MSAPRKATKIPGLKYTEHPTRKNGLQKDKYYLIIYKMKGKQKEEAIGWASQGWTEKKAAAILFELKENQRKGEGPQTLKEKRELLQKKAEEEEAKKQKEAIKEITFKEVFDQFLNDGAKGAKYIYDERKKYEKWLAKIIGNMPINKIDYKLVDQIKDILIKAGMSDRTVQSTIGTIKHTINFAIKHSIFFGVNPVKLVNLPKVDNKRMRFYSKEQIKLLFDALKKRSQQTYEIAYLSLYTGLRASSIFKLEWSDIDFEHNLITVRKAKGKISATLPLTDKVRTLLLSKKILDSYGLIFRDRNGKMIKKISKVFPETVKALGINSRVEENSQKDVFHTLRHTYASWLVSSGVDLYTTQHLLMHKNITTTQRYAHLAPDYLRKAVKVLDKIDIK